MGMTEVVLTGRLICTAEADAAVVRDALTEHVRLSRAKSGCLAFDIAADPSDPLVFRIAERFLDAASFEAHTVRTRTSDWWARTAHIRRDIADP